MEYFCYSRLQLELISTSNVTWVPYCAEHGLEGFVDGYPAGPEVALSIRRVPLLTLGGWELYLGERAFRCVIGKIQIPPLPLIRRLWDLTTSIVEILMDGIDGRLLSDGPYTSEAFHTWWLPFTIGPQAKVCHFLGDTVPGPIMMSESMA